MALLNVVFALHIAFLQHVFGEWIRDESFFGRLKANPSLLTEKPWSDVLYRH